MRLPALVVSRPALWGPGSLLLVLSAVVPIVATAAPAAAPAKPATTISPDAVTPPITNGTCPYTPLTSGVAVPANVDMNYPFTQLQPYWSAIGVRPTPQGDWDINVNDATGIDPVCVTGPIISSVEGAGVVDVIVGDFNHNPLKTYIAHAYPFGGTSNAIVEWDDGPDGLGVDNYGTFRTTGPSDVLECFDVFLEAGRTYSITLASTGQAEMSLYFFANSTDAPYWTTLTGAVFSIPGIPEGLTGNFAATKTDWYGIVVVNENGKSGEYNLRVNTCLPAFDLAENVSDTALGNTRPYSFTPSSTDWAAAGVLASNPTQDWDLSLWHNYGVGGGYPCLTGEYATSHMGFGKADVVAIDFNQTPLGTVYARPFPSGPTNTAGTLQWDDGPDHFVLGTPVTRATGIGDVVHIWDVSLQAGHVYRVEISSLGSAVAKAVPNPECTALLFRNDNGASPYAAGRQDADLETRTVAAYNAPTTASYGLAVVNDDGGTGQYTVNISETSVVGASPPGAVAYVTRLVSLSPNPATAGAATRIAFELAKPGRVGFELVDVAGRVRRRLDPVAFEGGPAVATWALRGSAAGSEGAAGGVYFLRMSVDGRPVGSTRLVMLDGGVN